jgi:hypothetical protein
MALYLQIHDQGAGGNCNVVKEIIYPLGAEINVRKVKLGDSSMSVLEIWGAEYQENDCILIKAEDEGLLQSICDRERTFMQVRIDFLAFVDVDVDFQYIAISALQALTAPVPWDAICDLASVNQQTRRYGLSPKMWVCCNVARGVAACFAA